MKYTELIIKHSDELKEKFGADAVLAYQNVSHTQLSVARHYGAAKVNGNNYLYVPPEDMLVRQDVMTFLNKLVKKVAGRQPLSPTLAPTPDVPRTSRQCRLDL